MSFELKLAEWEDGVPLFPRAVQECHALNAAPYLLEFEDFSTIFGTSARRTSLITSLRSVLTQARQLDAEPKALLVGGSFLRLRNQIPKDIDCICFYRADVNGVAKRLVEVQARAREASVDLRFIPLGEDPLIALKACSFFTALYSISRASHAATRGSILVHW